MNRATRRKIAELVDTINDMVSQAEAIGEETNELADTEQDKFDNMPEGLQQGDGGIEIEAAAEKLSEANDHIADVVTTLYEAIQALEEAAGE